MDSQGLHALNDARIAAQDHGVALGPRLPLPKRPASRRGHRMTDVFEIRDTS